MPRPDAFEAARVAFAPAFAPFCVGRIRFIDWMQDKAFKITSAELIPDNSGDIKIEWECPYSEPKVGKVNRSGYVIVSPRKGWAIVESDRSLSTAENLFIRSNKVRVEYTNSLDGIPIVEHVDEWSETGADRKRTDEKSYEKVVFHPESIPASDFSLSAFGISSPETKPHSQWVLYLNIAVVVLILLAIIFRKLSKRHASGST